MNAPVLFIPHMDMYRRRCSVSNSLLRSWALIVPFDMRHHPSEAENYNPNITGDDKWNVEDIDNGNFNHVGDRRWIDTGEVIDDDVQSLDEVHSTKGSTYKVDNCNLAISYTNRSEAFSNSSLSTLIGVQGWGCSKRWPRKLIVWVMHSLPLLIRI